MSDRTSGETAGQTSQLETGFFSSIGNKLQSTYNLWFGPGIPQQQNAPENTEPRSLDYPVTVNLQRSPKVGEGITFKQLRQLSRSLDIMRAIIETRKDQVGKQTGQFRLKAEPDEVAQSRMQRTQKDPRIASLNQFMQYPDKEHDFATWTRMLMEEMLVLDAPAIWMRPNLIGELHSLRVMDGSTIKRVVDETGATPTPDMIWQDGPGGTVKVGTAYQLITKGLISAEFTTDELIYMPRNPSADRIYGYSPVEQVATIVLIGLRRMDFQLKAYTHGNMPMALIRCPETWTGEQIRKAQIWFDNLLEGKSEKRSKAIFIPNAEPVFPQAEVLKDEFDEWIARVIAYVFGVPPTPFIKQMNRATADNSSSAAAEEGEIPGLTWIKTVFDFWVNMKLGWMDIEWTWDDEEDENQLDQAKIDQIYCSIKVDAPSEIRARRGKAPLTAQQQAEIEANNPTPQPEIGAPEGSGGSDGGSGKGSNAGKGVSHTHNRSRKKGAEKFY